MHLAQLLQPEAEAEVNEVLELLAVMQEALTAIPAALEAALESTVLEEPATLLRCLHLKVMMGATAVTFLAVQEAAVRQVKDLMQAALAHLQIPEAPVAMELLPLFPVHQLHTPVVVVVVPPPLIPRLMAVVLVVLAVAEMVLPPAAEIQQRQEPQTLVAVAAAAQAR